MPMVEPNLAQMQQAFFLFAAHLFAKKQVRTPCPTFDFKKNHMLGVGHNRIDFAIAMTPISRHQMVTAAVPMTTGEILPFPSQIFDPKRVR